MLRQTNRLWIIVAITTMFTTGGMLGNAAAQKASVPKPQDKLALVSQSGGTRHLALAKAQTVLSEPAR
jgi:hypothetical protein